MRNSFFCNLRTILLAGYIAIAGKSDSKLLGTVQIHLCIAVMQVNTISSYEYYFNFAYLVDDKI